MPEIPDHLTPIASSRGFVHMPELRSPRKDDAIHVYESSNAEGPRVRVGIDPRDDIPVIELSAEDAWRLGEQLLTLVANHYQGDARPEERWAELVTRVRTVQRRVNLGLDLDADGNVVNVELLETLEGP